MTQTCPLVYDEELIFDKIKQFPQTYETLLGKCWANNTEQVLLRKRLNRLSEDGRVLKSVIPGTRHGKCLFFVHTKKQHVVVEGSRYGVNVYAFEKYKREGEKKLHVRVDKCWQLNGVEWKECGKNVFFEGDIIKVI